MSEFNVANILQPNLREEDAVKRLANVPPTTPAAGVEGTGIGGIVGAAAGAGLSIAGTVASENLKGVGDSVFDEEVNRDITDDKELSGTGDELRNITDPVARQEAMTGLDDLTKISRMRKAGVITGAEAQLRANTLIKRKMNSPLGFLFADKLKSTAKEFFDAPVGGNFFADAKETKTPQQKALAAHTQSVYELQYSTGLSDFNIAEDALIAQARREFKAKELTFIAQNKDLTGDQQAALTTTRVIQNTGTFYASIKQQMGVDGLSQDSRRALEQNVLNTALQMREELRATSVNADGDVNLNSSAYKDANNQISDWVKQQQALLGDQSALKLIQEKSDQLALSSLYDFQRDVPGFTAAQTLGNGGMEFLIETQGRGKKVFGAVATAGNPFLQELQRQIRTGQVKGNDQIRDIGMGQVIKADEPVTTVLEAQSMGAVMLEPDAANVIGESVENGNVKLSDKMIEALKIAPDTVTAYTKDAWTARFNSNPKVWGPKVEQMHRTAVASSMSAVMAATSDFTKIPKIRFMPEDGDIANPRLQGNILAKLDTSTKQRVGGAIYGVLRMARNSPFIWENDFETAVDYTNWRLSGLKKKPPLPQKEAPQNIPLPPPPARERAPTEEPSSSGQTAKGEQLQAISTKLVGGQEMNAKELKFFDTLTDAEQRNLNVFRDAGKTLGKTAKPRQALDSLIRNDGTEKGSGFLGVLKNRKGQDVTEYSVGVEIDGREVEIPTLIPGLSAIERAAILQASEEQGPVPPGIVRKAAEHARKRIADGLSPFHVSGDLGQ